MTDEKNTKRSADVEAIIEPLQAIAKALQTTAYHHVVPAAPGFTVIDVDEDYTVNERYPVVAFRIQDDPEELMSMQFFCTDGYYRGVNEDYALAYPDGRVLSCLGWDKRLGENADVLESRTFKDEDAFLSALHAAQKILAETEPKQSPDEAARPPPEST